MALFFLLYQQFLLSIRQKRKCNTLFVYNISFLFVYLQHINQQENIMSNTKTIKNEPILHRSIFFFYEQGLKYVPIVLMLCHWFGTINFHGNPREILVDIQENEPCIIFLYFMTYVFPLLFMIPASYFFRHCWIWRIPFTYIIGVNAIRIYYHSFLITNDMKDADYVLIVLIILLYIYGIIQVLCRSLFKN